MSSKAKKIGEITISERGNVRFWSVYRQCWESCHVNEIEDQELAAMPKHEREAVRMMQKKCVDNRNRW